MEKQEWGVVLCDVIAFIQVNDEVDEVLVHIDDMHLIHDQEDDELDAIDVLEVLDSVEADEDELDVELIVDEMGQIELYELHFFNEIYVVRLLTDEIAV